jgi:hypothetical protein
LIKSIKFLKREHLQYAMGAVVFNFWFKTFERALVQNIEELKYQCEGELSVSYQNVSWRGGRFWGRIFGTFVKKIPCF